LLQVLDVQSFVDLTCEKNKAKRDLMCKQAASAAAAAVAILLESRR
jgi:hypothetical protein